MIKIESIEKNSLADEAGLLAGDRLLRINGEEVRDRLDFEFMRSEESIEAEWMRGDQLLRTELKRSPGKTLGIIPEVMKIHLCKNNCVFCFVHQTPRGMRRSLYVKDEDYRYSFLDGHFTTLSNMSQAEWDRILKQKLSPLYVSVHATEPDLRARLLKNDRIEPIMDRLAWLEGHGIDFHTQIVVVPGWNDGEHLARSLQDLLAFESGLLSISVVPVGLTDHRKHLTDLRKLNREDAREALSVCQRFAQESERRLGENVVFASDEMYVLAEEEIPPAEFYGDFGQYENGVGTLRALIQDFEEEKGRLPLLPPDSDWNVTVLTAPVASGVKRSLMEKLRVEKSLHSELLICENVTFGKSVTVTGLLCGKDFATALESSRGTGPILIPPNSLNDEGCFLDDMKPADLEARFGRPVFAPTCFRDYFPGARSDTQAVPIRTGSCAD